VSGIFEGGAGRIHSTEYYVPSTQVRARTRYEQMCEIFIMRMTVLFFMYFMRFTS